MTLSREQIATIIERKHPIIPKEVAIKLGRDLHLALTTETVLERNDEWVAATVSAARERIEKTHDIVAEFNRFLMKSKIGYTDQKILQWFMATAVSKGKK